MRYFALLLALIAVHVVALKSGSSGPRKNVKKGNRPASPGQAAAPRRITSASTKGGLSLRTQLQLVKKVKQQQSGAVVKAGASPVKANKKKKKKSPEGKEYEDINDECLYEKPLLLVDGYNVIFGNDELNALSSELGLEAARRQLVSEVSALATVRSWEASVIFDGREADGSEEWSDDQVVRVVYTRGLDSADAVIERQAAERRVLGNGATIVATNDNLIRLMASASNADLFSVDQLCHELNGAKSAISSLLIARQRANAISGLTTSLSDAPAGLELLKNTSKTNFALIHNGLSLETALRNKFIGEHALAREAATQRRRQALQDGLKAILARLDAAGNKRSVDDLRTLHDIETTVLPRFDGLDAWLRHQKQLFGLLDLMQHDWEKTALQTSEKKEEVQGDTWV